MVTNGGDEEVPKYTLYEVAPLAAFQLNVEVSDSPVAPLLGEISVGAPGGDTCVPNDHVAELVEPAPFLAMTFQ